MSVDSYSVTESGVDPLPLAAASSKVQSDPDPSCPSSPESHETNLLRWDEYPQSMANTIRSLKEEEDFVDVTLACNGQQFTAHKVVLSACSPYFRKLLKSNPCQHPIVILRDISIVAMRSLLQFMYTGEVRVEESQLKDLMKTADTLQITGLMHAQNNHGNSRNKHNVSSSDLFLGPSSAKRSRTNGSLPRDSSSPIRVLDKTEPNNQFALALAKTKNTNESLLSQALEKQSSASHSPLLLRTNLSSSEIGDRDNESASDTASDRPDSIMDSSEQSPMHHHSRGGHSSSSSLFPPGLEALYRQAGFPSAFLGLASGAGSAPPTSTATASSSMHGLTNTVQHGGLQSHAGNPNFSFSSDVSGKLDMMRVRATDPRPCPKCGKIYRSAHTLRTHMEDKHTICPGYRCVLCGTVAKSRNSLHSHMSRQHRGISTKELPVLPMPAPFDADLAARLLNKAGVKVSSRELAARASPTAPRRGDLPKLDSNLLHMQQQFPLPASIPAGMASGLLHERMSRGNRDDMDDIRSQPSPFGANNGADRSGFMISSRGGLTPKDFGAGGPGGMGSALLDTYLSMIAAAGGAGGGDTNAMAAALNLQNSAVARSAAAAFAAANAASAASSAHNGDNKSQIKEDEDMEGELGSDADNDDISDGEENEKEVRAEDESAATAAN